MSGPDDAHAASPVPGLAAAPSRRDRTLPAIVLLALLALGGTLALLPGAGERAEGLLGDGRYDDAIEILAAVEGQRPLDAYEGYLLFKLYILTRQPENAATLLAREPALLANDAGVLGALSALFREQRNMRGEAAILRQRYEIGPNSADFARLRILYRLLGDTGSEASLLARAIEAGQSEPAYVERLAYLRSLPSQGGGAALWVAPASSFSRFADASLDQASTAPQFAPFPATSLE
jgi:hypothetical protein